MNTTSPPATIEQVLSTLDALRVKAVEALVDVRADLDAPKRRLEQLEQVHR